MIHLINLDKTNITPKVKDLYLTAFPKYERYPFWLLKYKAKKTNSDFFAIYNDKEYIGLLYLIYYKDIVYIFYFAIEPAQQSKGYGSMILQQLQTMYKDRRLFLNIEKVDSSTANHKERLKRKKFYERNGFKNANFEIENKHVAYEILYNGEEVYEVEYYALYEAYLGRILYFLL